MELAANKIVCLTLFLTTSVGLAADDVSDKPADDVSVRDAYTAQQEVIASYERDITYREAEGGAYDSALAESLFGLGKAYQEAEDHARALEYFKQSRHINKINNGLYSLTQEPILREIIKSHSAIGDWEATAAGFDALYLISSRTYGDHDPRMIPVLDELAQWHLNAFVQKKNPEPNHLAVSQSLTNRAISLIQKHAGEADLRLVDLLRFKALSSYYVAQTIGDDRSFIPVRSLELNRESLLEQEKEKAVAVGNSYRSGRKSYEKLIEVLYNNPEATKLDRANAYAELGDWFLLFDRRESAKRAYTDALALFDNETERAEAQKKLFGSLRRLPASVPANKFYDPDPSNSVLVEAKLNTTRFGYTRRAELISIEPASGDTRAKRIKLKKVIRSNRFRPAFQDGKLVPRSAMVFKFRFEG